MQVPEEAEIGNHVINITINTSAYGIISMHFLIKIYSEPTSVAIVTILDNETNTPIQDAIIMIDDNATLHYTDSNGKTSFETSFGTHTFFAWKQGYLPKAYSTFINIGCNNITIKLEKGRVMIVNVSAKPMNYTEIIEAGINIQDPENYDFYEFKVDLYIKEHKLTEYEVWFDFSHSYGGSWSGFVDGEWKNYIWMPKGYDVYKGIAIHYNDGKGHTGYFYGIGNLLKEYGYEAPAWIHVEGAVHFLKEFFNVSVVIINNAPSSFIFSDTEAEIKLPSGLSLPLLYGNPQPTIKQIGDIAGQENGSTSWIIRGDDEGEYVIDVNVTAKLMPFDIPIYANGSTFIKVYGKARLQPIFMPARYVRKGMPFILTIGLHNPTHVPAYCVSVELYNNALKNVTLIDDAIKYLGTIQPGQTKYAAWKLLPSVSGFIILDASSIYTDDDYDLNPHLTFYDDTPEGAVTAYYIASQQVLNAEVHAFSGEITQFRMVYRTTPWDAIWLLLEAASTANIIGAYGLSLSLIDVAEGIGFNILFDHEILNTQTERQILENMTRLILMNLPINISTFDKSVTAFNISQWLTEKYEDIVDLIRDSNFNEFTDEDHATIIDIIDQMQIAARQNTILRLGENYSIVGKLYPLLFEAIHLREEYELWGTIGKLLTIGSLVSLLTPSGPIVPIMLSIAGAATGTYKHLIKIALYNVTATSIVAYLSDMENLTMSQSNVFNWIENIVLSGKYNQLEAYNQLFQQYEITILNFSTPDIVVNETLIGNATGTLHLKSNCSTNQSLSGRIIVRRIDNGSTITQTIPLSYNLHPYEEINISFNYTAALLPGISTDYIVEAYISVENHSLPTVFSLFHVYNIQDKSNEIIFTGDIKDLESETFNLTVGPYSTAIIASSTSGLELHLWDANRNHLGMNYTSGIIDENIVGAIYSGYQTLPQWIKVVNDENISKTYVLKIYGVNVPNPKNFTVRVLIANMSKVPSVYPRTINLAVANNITNHIIVAYQGLGNVTKIDNVVIQGNIADIVTRIWYPKTNLSFGESGLVDLTIFPLALKTYTGILNLSFITDNNTCSIPVNIVVQSIDIPPSISNVQASPSIQEIDGYVNITSTVIDNIAVDEVYLNITYPDGSYENFSITQNKTGNEYYCNRSYSQLGLYEFFIWAIDINGNGNSSSIYNFSIVDNFPPQTTHSLNPSLPNGNNGWYVSNVTITLNANDNASGINKTLYKINDGNWKEYNGAFIISEEGEHVIQYYSIDNAGNEEEKKSFSIKVDKSKPVTTHSLNPSLPNGNNGWYVSNVTITLNANDSMSEVNVTKYKIDDGNWKKYDKAFIISEEGEHTIKYYSIDSAGNEEDQKEINIKIDKTKPVTTHSLNPSLPNGNNGWYVSNVTITLNANDSISGVNVTKYKIDDGNWKKYTKPIKIINNGGHTIKYYSIDNAGNEEEMKTIEIKIDKAKPAVGIKKPDNGIYFFGRKIFPSFSIIIIGKIKIEVIANDSYSGVSHVEFYIDGVKKCNVSNEPYEYIWDERAFFKHTIKAIVYDKAGNKAKDEIEVMKFF